MADNITVARPYAEAVFGLAWEQNRLEPWLSMLLLLAAVAKDARFARVVADPRVDRELVAKLLLDICGKRLDGHGENFMRLLLANRRFNLLPEIAELVSQLKAEAEKRVEVELTSAFAIDDVEVDRIAQTLKQNLKREVQVTPKVDPSLVGGARLRIGDRVIDGSVSGRLHDLSSYLSR